MKRNQEVYRHRSLTMIFVIVVISTIGSAQVDGSENYFPFQINNTWVYNSYPTVSTERIKTVITKDSLALEDSSHLIFINNGFLPKYRIDKNKNVFENPAGSGSNKNQLIFKQTAKLYEAWPAAESSKTIYRIKEVGTDFILGRSVKYKIVEWGTTTAPDTFGMSRKSEYYASGIGLYQTIVEPSIIERTLVGYIFGGDTIGSVAKVKSNNDNRSLNYTLYNSYPNPFNPSTTIGYDLPKTGLTTLKVYNSLGQEVATLVSETQEPGRYSVNFEGSRLSSGMYDYKLTSGSFSQTKRMMLVK